MHIQPVLAPLHVDPPSELGFVATSWGEQVRARVSCAQTIGRLAVFDYRAPRNFGPPRHVHRNDDEIFAIEQGSIALWTPYETRTASAGDVVLLPSGTPHAWRAFGEEPVRLKLIVSPGDFEAFFETIAEQELTLSDTASLAEIASAAGMEIVGAPLSDDEVTAIRENRWSEPDTQALGEPGARDQA
ncbi:MAG: cupin domain-containing protein [Hansschlegelia sp.]